MYHINWTHLGQDIRLARHRAQLTLQSLSDRTQVSVGTLGRLETGVKRDEGHGISAVALWAVTRELGLSLDALFTTHASKEHPDGCHP